MLTALERNCCFNCRNCSAAKKKVSDSETKTATSPTSRNLVRMERNGRRKLMARHGSLLLRHRARMMAYPQSRQVLPPPIVSPPRRRELQPAGLRRASLFDRSNTQQVVPRSVGAPAPQTPG